MNILFCDLIQNYPGPERVVSGGEIDAVAYHYHVIAVSGETYAAPPVWNDI